MDVCEGVEFRNVVSPKFRGYCATGVTQKEYKTGHSLDGYVAHKANVWLSPLHK